MNISVCGARRAATLVCAAARAAALICAASRAAALLALSCVLLLAPSRWRSAVHAQAAASEAQDPGVAGDALPGVRHLALATPFDDGLSAAGTFSYGYTDSVEQVRDAHHRLLLDAAASYAVTELIALGGRFGGHFDAHVGGDSDGDASLLLSTRLFGRARIQLNDGLFVGGELALTFPGADNIDRGLKSVTPELRALGSYTGLHPKLVLGAQLGARFDRSGEGVRDPANLSGGDRVAFGASDSSAILLGVGGTFRALPELLVLGELGWEPLVGSRAPSALKAPMRITGGVRYELTSLLALDGFVTLSPSSRPDVGQGEALVPIEPRITLGVGLSARFAKRPVVRPATLAGHIVDELGEPIAGASVTATDGASRATLTATTDSSGAFTLSSVEGARLQLRAQAEHRVPGQLEVVLATQAFDLGDWALPRGRGALVGRVLGPNGMPKAGAVVGAYTSPEGSAVDAPPLASMVTTEDGTFVLRDLPAGSIQLRATAPLGLRDAQQEVVVPVQTELSVELTLAEALPEGQIRGTVRGIGGAPLAATVRVEPLGLVLSAQRDGTFSIDVVPGRYEVLVTAPGYEPQQRVADVERDGVTVLPVDLVRQP